MSIQSAIPNKGRILMNNKNNINNNNNNNYVGSNNPNNFYNYNTEKDNNDYTNTYNSNNDYNNSYNSNTLLVRSPIKYLCVDKYTKNQVMTQGSKYNKKSGIKEIQVDLSPKQNFYNKNVNNITTNVPNLALNSPTSSIIESCIITFDKKKGGNINRSVDNLKLPKNSPKSKKIYVNKKKIPENSYDYMKYNDDINKYNNKYVKKHIQKNNDNYNNINIMSSGIYEIPINNDISNNNNKIYQKPKTSPEKNDYDYGKVQNYCAPSPNYAYNYKNMNDNYENYSDNYENNSNNFNEINVTFDKNVNLMNSNYNLNNKISAANGHINPKTGIYMKKNKTNSNIHTKNNNNKINNVTPFDNYINKTPIGDEKKTINIKSTIQNEHSFYEIIYNYFTKLPRKKLYYMSKRRLKIIKKPIVPLCYIEKYKHKIYKPPIINESYYTKVKIPNPYKLPNQNICFIQKIFINKNIKYNPQKIVKIKKKVIVHKMMNVNNNKKIENQNINNNNPDNEINNKNKPIQKKIDNFPKNNLYIRGKFKTQKPIRLEKPKDTLDLNININQEIKNKESQITDNANKNNTNNLSNDISNTNNSLNESQIDNISSNKQNMNKSATENNNLHNLSGLSNIDDDKLNKTMNLFNPRKKIKNIKIKTSVRISRNNNSNKAFKIQKKKTITKDNNSTKFSSSKLLINLKENDINQNENILNIIKKIKEDKTKKQKVNEEKINSILMEDLENYLIYSENYEKNNDKLNTTSKKINYDWSMIEQLIIKIKQDLIDIINNYLNACVNLVDSKEKVLYANEYIQIIIDYYIKHYLTKNNLNIIRDKLLYLIYKIEDVNIDNRFKFDVLGKLFLGLIKEGLFFVNDYNLYTNCEEEIQINLAKLARYIIIESEEEQEAKKFYLNFKTTKLFINNPIFFKFVTKFLKENLKC